MYQKEKSQELQRWASITVLPGMFGGALPSRRVGLVVALILLISLLLLAMLPAKHLLERYEDAVLANQTHVAALDPVLSGEIEALKGQLSAIITGSIESKLRSLESRIRNGTVSEADLGMIEDLKSDLNILVSYSARRPEAAPVKIGGHDKRPDANPEKRYIAEELSQLKVLFYVSIASSGFLAVAMGGIWLGSAHKFKLLLNRDIKPHVMLEASERDIA